MWISLCAFCIVMDVLLDSTHAVLYRQVTDGRHILVDSFRTLTARSKLECFVKCNVYQSCVAVHYTSKRCNFLKPQTVCSEDFPRKNVSDVFLNTEEKGLELDVFRTSAGTGAKFYDPWISDSYQSTCDESVWNMDQKINFTFKHSVLKHWDELNILQVRLTLWKSGEEVVRLVFDGRRTDKLNWFSQNRLLQSSFTDLKTNTDVTMSIPGYHETRRFYIRQVHWICNGDTGWMCLKEIGYNCGWENHRPYPTFLYSTSSKVTAWSNGKDVGLADDLLISLTVGL